MRRSAWAMFGFVVLLGAVAQAQLASHADTPQAATAQEGGTDRHRTRLILKDGSYQIVMSYKVVGSRVQFVSAERGGEAEEIPLDLVDIAATKKWEQRQTEQRDEDSGRPRPAPVLSPELAKEERMRAELAPQVAPDLRLVPEDSVLALDTWHGSPELVPMLQSEGDLNRQTGHSILRAVINPNSAAHQVLELKGEKSAIQMHVNDPVFYIRMDDDAAPTGEVMTVETHGASSSAAVKEKRTSASQYAIVRVDVRQDARVVASFHTSMLGAQSRQEDVVETASAPLPGGHWMKVSPTGPMLIGEYCLVEVLAENQINLSVWDFGVHPTAPENRDVLRPEKPRTGLERHPQD